MAPVTWWGRRIKRGIKPVTRSLAVTDLLRTKSLLPSVQRLISAHCCEASVWASDQVVLLAMV